MTALLISDGCLHLKPEKSSTILPLLQMKGKVTHTLINVDGKAINGVITNGCIFGFQIQRYEMMHANICNLNTQLHFNYRLLGLTSMLATRTLIELISVLILIILLELSA
jgi:hypothetical protein